jgi:hypothetical protein
LNGVVADVGAFGRTWRRRRPRAPSCHVRPALSGTSLCPPAWVDLHQKVRISQFAENEKNFPLGITAEQQRREVITLADLLMKMRDTQIALGLVPRNLGPQINVSSSTSIFGASVDDEVLGSDPFTRLLLDNPQAISIVMSGIDRALAEAGAMEGQATAVTDKDRQGG